MKLAVLSGKGGTGKTLVSVNLAATLKKATYMDCDVEEPNGYLFLKPQGVSEKEVTISIPEAQKEKCNGCRTCVSFCKFNALAYIREKPLVFEDVCHACGGCILLCPQNAFIEKEKPIGKIEEGKSEDITVYTGILDIGNASGVPIIKELLEKTSKNEKEWTVIDCPPGSACIVMESIKEVDYCILVAEPTVFGAHNLAMVYELVQSFHKPLGVVLNKCMDGENPSEIFCKQKGIKILGKIGFDQTIGKLNSEGRLLVKEAPSYASLFEDIIGEIRKEMGHETVTCS